MWVKIDDKMPHHPKIVRAGGRAAWMWVAGICYANEHNTGGFVPAEMVRRLTDERNLDQLAQRLVKVGLWDLAEGGYHIHDYADYQTWKTDTARAALSRKRSDSGRIGGINSGKIRSGRSKLLEHGKQFACEATKQKRSPDPDPDPDPGSEEEGDSEAGGEASASQSLPPGWGKGAFQDLWLEVVKKNFMTSNHPQQDRLVRGVVVSCRIAKRIDTPLFADVQAHARALLSAFVGILSVWGNFAPGSDYDAFERHFAKCESVVMGERTVASFGERPRGDESSPAPVAKLKRGP